MNTPTPKAVGALDIVVRDGYVHLTLNRARLNDAEVDQLIDDLIDARDEAKNQHSIAPTAGRSTTPQHSPHRACGTRSGEA